MLASILMLRSGFHTAIAVYQWERPLVDAHGEADWIPNGLFHTNRDYRSPKCLKKIHETQHQSSFGAVFDRYALPRCGGETISQDIQRRFE